MLSILQKYISSLKKKKEISHAKVLIFLKRNELYDFFFKFLALGNLYLIHIVLKKI